MSASSSGSLPVSRTPWVVLLLTGAASSEGPWLHQSGQRVGRTTLRCVINVQSSGDAAGQKTRGSAGLKEGVRGQHREPERRPPRPPRLSRRRQSEPSPTVSCVGHFVTQGLATSGRPPQPAEYSPPDLAFSRPNHTLGAAQSRSPRDRDTPPAISLATHFSSSLKFLINPKGKKVSRIQSGSSSDPHPHPATSPQESSRDLRFSSRHPLSRFHPLLPSNKIIHVQSRFNSLQSPPISPLWLKKSRTESEDKL